jgi:nitrile hydratase subunit beta
MNGAHDLGGSHGLGPIAPEAESVEPVFHHEWERRAFALTLACGFLGQWNLDESRHARERQHPVDYLRHSYYEQWLAGLSTLLVEKGLVTAEELTCGVAQEPATESMRRRTVVPERVIALLEGGGPVDMPAEHDPVYTPGDEVRVVNNHPHTHTRVPRYVRGRMGTVFEHHGCHVFADANSRGERRGEHLYSVRFEAHELWGEGVRSHDAVYVDLWEPHLKFVS